jgi:hypothetical protein
MTTDCAEPSDSLDPTLQMVAGVSCLLAAAGLRVEISPVGGAVVLQVAFASLALAAKACPVHQQGEVVIRQHAGAQKVSVELFGRGAGKLRGDDRRPNHAHEEHEHKEGSGDFVSKRQPREALHH